jgi:hypothetical protein
MAMSQVIVVVAIVITSIRIVVRVLIGGPLFFLGDLPHVSRQETEEVSGTYIGPDLRKGAIGAHRDCIIVGPLSDT